MRRAKRASTNQASKRIATFHLSSLFHLQRHVRESSRPLKAQNVIAGSWVDEAKLVDLCDRKFGTQYRLQVKIIRISIIYLLACRLVT